jgi:hypothetical protein
MKLARRSRFPARGRMSGSVLATHVRPSLLDGEWRMVIGEWSKTLFAIRHFAIRTRYSLFPLHHRHCMKGRQNADRRVVKDPHHRMRLASSGTRSPVGVPPRLLRQRPNATAQLQLRASWDGTR